MAGYVVRDASAQGTTPASGCLGRPISIEGVSRRYGSAVAVERLDLHIAAGELVTLLGPSGSGKTTTLMMVAGFTQPSGGRILIGDRDVTHLPTHRRDIGVVFQQYALFPHMTVAENVAFPLRMRGAGRAERENRVARALELVEMGRFAPRFPSELSGGQQQRVAFARAIVFDPPVLLLDEPLGALDKKLREALQIEIKALHARLGLTMIYVTHDQAEALAISDRVVVMNEGKLEQAGPPAELYEAPKSRFVADFIGEANFVQGTVSSLDAERVQLCAFGTVRLDAIAAPGHAGRFAPGQPAELMIRPERIRLASPPPSNRTVPPNTLVGCVEDRSYVGDATRLTVRIRDDLAVTLRHPNTRAAAAAGAPGTRIALAWDAEDALVFPTVPREPLA